MDDNQCRVCLGEAEDSRYSVYKKVNGVTIEEKLQFVCCLTVRIEVRQSLNRQLIFGF
jgi:hypothetical protein